jgi:hypothetical protein
MSDNYRPTSAKATRDKARQSTTRANEIVDKYGIGKQDMAVIYMSPSLYHEAFQTYIRKFDLSTHATAGLNFYKSGQRLHLNSIASSTPAAKIPDWRSCIRGAWLIKVNGTDVASPDDVALALKLLQHNEMAKVKLLFSHPEIRPNLSQDGMAVFHLVWTYAIKAVDSRKKARWACDGSPRSGQAQILDETYANFVDQTSARLFYAIAAAENLAVFGADVSNAYAKAPPPKQGFYIYPDRAFQEWWVHHKKRPLIQPREVIPILSAMQGHPESPRLWEKHADAILRE